MHRTALAFTLALTVIACGDNNDGGGAPRVDDLTLTTEEDTPVMRALGITGGDASTLTVRVAQPLRGNVTLSGARNVTYTPAPDYNGTDAFSVTVSDDAGREDTATVSITIAPVNDLPTGVADAFATNEDDPHQAQVTTLLANDVDPDGDTLTIASVGDATNGTVTLTGTDVIFTPAADFVGTATYRYTATDGTATSEATVTITVGGVNDAPVATDDTGTTAEDTDLVVAAASLVANDTDPDAQTLTVTDVTAVTGGVVTLAGGNITFAPTANFNGAAAYTYTVSDGALTDTGTVTITVTAVNDAPVATDDTASTAEDTPVTILESEMIANDTDVDTGTTLTVTAAANPVGGTVSIADGDVTFIPTANFTGAASFEYTLSDGTLTDTGVVALTISPVNDAPVANGDSATAQTSVATDYQTTVFLANDTDVDGNTLAITAVSNPSDGATVSLTGTTITYTSAVGFTGNATFDYTVSDGAGGTATGTVSVNVVLVSSCGDGIIVSGEACDDDNPDPGDGCSASCQIEDGYTCNGQPSSCVTTCGDGIPAGTEACDDDNIDPGDGCSATCQLETGYTCTGQPSTCTTTCGDAIPAGAEACDDGNPDSTDGCTTQCVIGVVCAVSDFANGDRFATDPATGTCYVSFDDDTLTYAAAQSLCVASGGYLATITSAAEQTLVGSVQNAAQNPWIGGDDTATEGTFRWVTGEPVGFTSFAVGQPDDDVGVGGGGDCLHLFNAAGEWNDTSCTNTTFVVGQICELEVEPCGDGVLQPGEQCDDANDANGDGCSATCTFENLVRFSFNGSTGSEVTAPADATPAGLAATPTMSRGSGLTASAGAGTFASTGFTAAAALDVNDYYSFTVTPSASMSLNALELDERRSNTGIRQWSIRSSVDNFAADLATFSVPDNDLTRTNQVVLLGAQFKNLTTAVEFRIYGFAAEAAGGSWRIDNVELAGTVAP